LFRSEEVYSTKIISAIDDRMARTIALAERQILITLQCGCHAPVGAFAEIVGDNIQICAFISDLEGKNFISRSITGSISDVFKLAEELANDLLSAGGQNILQDI